MTSDTDGVAADDDDEAFSSRLICCDCVREPFLKERIEAGGDDGVCFYCQEFGPSVSLSDFADRIEKALDRHFECTPSGPSDFERARERDFGSSWSRSGEVVETVIAELAEIDDRLAADVRSLLADRQNDADDDGGYPFDEDARYERKEVDDSAYQGEWNAFETSLRTRNRFFGLETVLKRVFEGLDEHKDSLGRSVIIEYGPATDIESFYRARVFQSTPALKFALSSPEREIGSPPSSVARDGRMNARGISVFYGALNPDVALSEVRPPVGSRVVIGSFQLLRKIRLLDLEALSSVFIEGSFFDPHYAVRLQHVKFLNTLSGRISKPVVPDDEPFDYLATQAIADFLANSEFSLDGVLYKSVYGGDGGKNVVLFNKSARVEDFSLPPGSAVEVYTYLQSADGDEPYYSIHEEVPSQNAPKNASDRALSTDSVDSHPSPMDVRKYDSDKRSPTLRLNRKSLCVRHVGSVQFNSEHFSVSHIRSVKSDIALF